MGDEEHYHLRQALRCQQVKMRQFHKFVAFEVSALIETFPATSHQLQATVLEHCSQLAQDKVYVDREVSVDGRVAFAERDMRISDLQDLLLIFKKP